MSKKSVFVALITIIAFALLLGLLVKVGRFKKPSYADLRNEVAPLIDALSTFYAASNQYPEHLSQLNGSFATNAVPDAWNGWIYHRPEAKKFELYKYTGRLRDTIWCRGMFDQKSHYEWWIDDESGQPRQPIYSEQ